MRGEPVGILTHSAVKGRLDFKEFNQEAMVTTGSEVSSDPSLGAF